MIDVHCHLNFHAYEKIDSASSRPAYDEMIQEAFSKGVTKIINTGTKLDSSLKAVELAAQYDNLYAIVGVHPHHADKVELRITNKELSNQQSKSEYQNPKSETNLNDQNINVQNVSNFDIRTSNLQEDRQDPDEWITELKKLAQMPKVVGIGEIGLDYYRYQSNGIVDVPLQKEVFEAQLQLAHDLDLPIQIHNRHAGKDILEILEHHRNLLKSDNPGMFHCFAGSLQTHKKALDLGFCIGFDGNSTYPGLAPGETVELKELISLTPMDRIVTETDSPFLTPVPHRGTQNKPSYVILVGRLIAKIKHISFEEVDTITSDNATRIFRL